MTEPGCAVMCNLINTHTHTHTHTNNPIITAAAAATVTTRTPTPLLPAPKGDLIIRISIKAHDVTGTKNHHHPYHPSRYPKTTNPIITAAAAATATTITTTPLLSAPTKTTTPHGLDDARWFPLRYLLNT